METDTDDWSTPQLDAIEDRLMANYQEFQETAMEWNRQWQREINRRAMARRRARERATQSNAPTVDEDAA
jgi:hypothetical protein